jgi:hypothetical protein
MYYVKDLQTAERVLAELRNMRVYDKAATLARLQRIRNEVACERSGDQAGLQAWTSIRKLYDAFKAAPDRDLKPLWHEAIQNTAAWGQSLR